MTPQAFIDLILPAAKASALRTKIPAGFTCMEAALESAWGASELTVKANNLFGVKADASWDGPTLALPTREYVGGKFIIVQAKWRAYPGWLASIEDHANFLLDNERYGYKTGTGAFTPGLTSAQFAEAIAKAGYATDPDYAAKIIQMMTKRGLLNV